MKVYTYSEARQHLAALLDTAQREGAVMIRRRGGQSFVVRPDAQQRSPLDVEGIDLGVTTDEIAATVREGRERYG